ncbi:MAG: peptidase M14 [Saprospirales bacterium]|nr:MAG: peptidase M14 [Saprospirales bacterium]
MRLTLILVVLSFFFSSLVAQDHQWFYEIHEEYREASLEDRFFTHSDVEPLIVNLKDHPDFEVNLEGESVQGRSIYLVKWGSGPKKVYLWTQMHGNEPTATMAVADIFNFLASDENEEIKEELAEKVTLLFLPMVNPDGAEVYKRRNALDVDLNRDAQRLQSPESVILKDVRDRYNPDFGFNLHDQSLYYGAGFSGKPVAIAFLAPAYNQEREVNKQRLNAMKLIAQLNEIVQEYAPGKVAKFSDAFEPRAFGDNMQRWGTSTILIESGGYRDDPEKQYLRKLHFTILMSSFFSIADGDFKNYSREAYESIPANRISIFDLVIRNAEVELPEGTFVLDLGYRDHIVFGDGHVGSPEIGPRLVDVGDLSTFGAYTEYDASGFTLKQGEIWPEVFKSSEELANSIWAERLQEGYTYFRLDGPIPESLQRIMPFVVLGPEEERPEFPMLGKNAALLMEKQGEYRYIVANGRMHNLVLFR